MKHIYRIGAFIFLAAVLSAAPPVRLHQNIENNGATFVLPGHLHPLTAAVQDLGNLDSSFALPRLEIHFQKTPAQSADLKALLAAQRDPTSKSYRKWLTPEQFAARFGVNTADLDKVGNWLENSGFSSIEISPSHTSIYMPATAAAANRVFNVSLHQYRRKNGKVFYANAADPVFPRALQGLVGSLTGLSNDRVHPFLEHRPHPQITIGINGNHFLAPADLATIYNLNPLYGQGTNGAGQTIAVVGQSDISLSDIQAFQTAAGLALKPPQILLAGSDPGSDPDDESEADLDLEWAGGMAPGAEILYVNSPNALDSAVYAIENNLAPVVSISYGLCEAVLSAADLATYNDAFQQANALGVTVVVASGDTGAAACDVDQTPTGVPETEAQFGLAVSFPASSPYVTAVGGTEFDETQGSFWDNNGHALSYIPEIAWNDTVSFKALAASGGGASTQFTKPDWQQGIGVPNDGFRDVPDIALSASPEHDAYLICSAGSCSNGFAPPLSQIYFVGGTSCAAPVFSAILALLNQTSKSSQGNINPAMYALASFNSSVFHDIQYGDNKVPCAAGSPNCANGALGFSAGLGYDQVTGLGSPDATQLIEQWGSDFQVSANPGSLTFNSGRLGSAAIQVTRFANFSGSVTFTCSLASSLTNTTCSIPGSVSGSGVATLTVTSTPSSQAVALFPLAFALLLRNRRRKLCLAATLALMCLLTAVSCGSGNSQGAGSTSHTLSGNVTVTATSGILSHTITIPVTIAPA